MEHTFNCIIHVHICINMLFVTPYRQQRIEHDINQLEAEISEKVRWVHDHFLLKRVVHVHEVAL